jgi:hypothetical protein
MPQKQTSNRARRDKRQGKAPTTQAGEFVREEMHQVRRGKGRARTTKQAIAIGLAMARRAGVKLPSPAKPKTKTRAAAPRPKRATASRKSLAQQVHEAATKRPAARRRRSS